MDCAIAMSFLHDSLLCVFVQDKVFCLNASYSLILCLLRKSLICLVKSSLFIQSAIANNIRKLKMYFFIGCPFVLLMRHYIKF